MKKSSKQILLERMHKVGGMPINENIHEEEKERKEGSMYMLDLDDISKNAEEFKSMLNSNEDLPAWVQDKITIANHNMEAINGWKKSQALGQSVNEDEYAEKAGRNQGIVNNMVWWLNQAIQSSNESVQEIKQDTDLDDETKAWIVSMFETINKRISGAIKEGNKLDESKKHKKKGNIRGLWGVDDDSDGLVDGSADGGFGGDGGGGESYKPMKEGAYENLPVGMQQVLAKLTPEDKDILAMSFLKGVEDSKKGFVVRMLCSNGMCPPKQKIGEPQAFDRGMIEKGKNPKLEIPRMGESEEKWMQDAVKHKGALSKRLGIPEDEDIPMEKINSEIKKLDAKYKDGEKMSADDREFKRQLTLAKTFKKTK